MKKLLILLFSFFLLSSPSVFADDISDFQIEGISIGDSLLDYMSEEEILKEIEENTDGYYYLNEPKKYVEVYLFGDFSSYDNLSFFIKNNSTNQYISNKNEKYTILSIFGSISYDKDFNSCSQKSGEIKEVLSDMFPNEQLQDGRRTILLDPSGNSISVGFFFDFDSRDRIQLECSDLDENFRIKNNMTDELNISINSAEIVDWFLN
jgi:hypothetical protein